ncbi:MAG: TrbG/VirB9 family P-type conjugative transfer protein [Rickettsiales bacterium]|nr:TrbG/VirB9 family P-type conjugative transfer protein [Rickettsiales bacterium]
MKKYLFVLMCAAAMFCAKNSVSRAEILNRNTPMPSDTRIKTYVYNPNEIYQIKFMTNYQSILELQEGENVRIITFGNPAGWSTPRLIDNQLFIKATEPGVKTNMIIITDRRKYFFEIMSSDEDSDSVSDAQITQYLQFFYPDLKSIDIPPKTAKVTLNENAMALATGRAIQQYEKRDTDMVANVGEINTKYTYSGNGKGITPVMAFDNGKKTFFRFANNNAVIPVISSIDHMGRETPIRTRISGEYVYVDTVEDQFTLRKGAELVCVFNEENGPSENRKVIAQAD